MGVVAAAERLEDVVADEGYELTLDPSLGAASEARRATRVWLAHSAFSSSLLDDLQLIVSELVTNAAIHARTRLRLVIRCDHRRVMTEVFDADPRLPSPGRSAEAVGGRGLLMVAQLSDRWGFEPLADGKRVWAELSVDDDDERASRPHRDDD
jgi:anti-sigma regulatory factor (Ser/Thr protein kinase)